MIDEMNLSKEQVLELFKSEVPFFLYCDEDFRNRIQFVRDQFSGILERDFTTSFSLKAQPNYQMVQTVQDCGLSLDVSSLSELKYALALGFPPLSIALGGCGLTDEAIRLAVDKEILAVHCDSLESLDVAHQYMAGKSSVFPKVTIRYQPNVLARTKLGLQAPEISDIKSGLLDGLHVYLGRDSFSLEVFEKALKNCDSLMDRKDLFKEDPTLFLGPGLPGNAEKVLRGSSGKVRFNHNINLEFGRALCASSGYYGAQVLSVKRGDEDRAIVIIDGGLQHLGSPWVTLKSGPVDDIPWYFDSKGHELKVDESQSAAIYGSLCLWQDCLHPRLPVPLKIKKGDWIIVSNMGAYGLTAGVPTFIGENLPKEFYLKNGKLKDITHRTFNVSSA